MGEAYIIFQACLKYFDGEQYHKTVVNFSIYNGY